MTGSTEAFSFAFNGKKGRVLLLTKTIEIYAELKEGFTFFVSKGENQGRKCLCFDLQ
jgi:hypothetical protein